MTWLSYFGRKMRLNLNSIPDTLPIDLSQEIKIQAMAIVPLPFWK
jgi:hypothetical protein